MLASAISGKRRRDRARANEHRKASRRVADSESA